MITLYSEKTYFFPKFKDKNALLFHFTQTNPEFKCKN